MSFQSWNDASIGWKPAKFNNVTSIALPASHIWVPDVGLLNR